MKITPHWVANLPEPKRKWQKFHSEACRAYPLDTPDSWTNVGINTPHGRSNGFS